MGSVLLHFLLHSYIPLIPYSGFGNVVSRLLCICRILSSLFSARFFWGHLIRSRCSKRRDFTIFTMLTSFSPYPEIFIYVLTFYALKSVRRKAQVCFECLLFSNPILNFVPPKMFTNHPDSVFTMRKPS